MDANEALGVQQVAGTLVGPKGSAKRMVGAAVANLAGGALAGGVASQAGRRSESAPDFGNVGYVAVTADEVAVVKAKTGAFKPKITGEVVARAPRGDVVSAELDKSTLQSTLTIAFVDGGAWQFEVGKIYVKSAEQVVQALAAH